MATVGTNRLILCSTLAIVSTTYFAIKTSVFTHSVVNKDRQFRHNKRFRQVRLTIVAVEKR
jgi:hypothetical protein